jgi:hypothetical protein
MRLYYKVCLDQQVRRFIIHQNWLSPTLLMMLPSLLETHFSYDIVKKIVILLRYAL